MITVVDYGLGNLGSVQNMFRKIGVETSVTNDIEVISNASKLVLPGVGSFDSGIRQIKELGLHDVLNRKALCEKVPILGICLGAQLMTKFSDEGCEDGLGWFDAHTKKFDLHGVVGRWPLPNIGWRDVNFKKNYSLQPSFNMPSRFYFVHSFFMEANDESLVSITSNYGVEFACGLHRENLHCVQFHPEKSHRFGFEFFKKLRKYLTPFFTSKFHFFLRLPVYESDNSSYQSY
ncbi:imidazole glycerol phosphate synthase subunit HisH [Pseudomonadales bacterium]|nr:imidazole glycerol phosphate synthase subunit HisH [Pseudomonadales bacterium]